MNNFIVKLPIILLFLFGIVLHGGCSSGTNPYDNEPIPDSVDMRTFMNGVWEMRHYFSREGLKSENRLKPEWNLNDLYIVKMEIIAGDTLVYRTYSQTKKIWGNGSRTAFKFSNKLANDYPDTVRHDNEEYEIIGYFIYENSRSVLYEIKTYKDGIEVPEPNYNRYYYWYRKIEWKE